MKQIVSYLALTVGLLAVVLATSRCTNEDFCKAVYPAGNSHCAVTPSPGPEVSTEPAPVVSPAPSPALTPWTNPSFSVVPAVSANSTIVSPFDPIVSGSSCAQVSWKDRGRAPKGYLRGMAIAFARNLCRYRSPATTVAGVIAGPLGSSDRDALALYGLGKDQTAEDRLLSTWALGIGLGMRESSGKYCEGRDMSASNKASDTAEAGTFQASYNSRGASLDRLNGLWAWYKAHPEACDLKVWADGVDNGSKACKPEPAGSGAGAEWQTFTRKCPAFGAEWAMTLTRTLRRHFGPLNTRAAEYQGACVGMLKLVRAAIDRDPGACLEVL